MNNYVIKYNESIVCKRFNYYVINIDISLLLNERSEGKK